MILKIFEIIFFFIKICLCSTISLGGVSNTFFLMSGKTILVRAKLVLKSPDRILEGFENLIQASKKNSVPSDAILLSPPTLLGEDGGQTRWRR